LDIFLGVNFNAFDICLEEAISLKNPGAFFPLQFDDAGSVEDHFPFLWGSAIIEVNPVRMSQKSREAEKRKEERKVD